MFKPEIYNKIKIKTKIGKEGDELKVTFPIYDDLTGEEVETIKETVLISELEQKKTLLQDQIDNIEDLIKDLKKI